jgi:hypothetical protein
MTVTVPTRFRVAGLLTAFSACVVGYWYAPPADAAGRMNIETCYCDDCAPSASAL